MAYTEKRLKLIIAGGRDYRPVPKDLERLNDFHKIYAIEEVVSGGARGADAFGEWWAREVGLPIQRFEPDWEEFGPAAGPIRNEQMAQYVSGDGQKRGAIILFPGGSGTNNMYKLAKKYDLMCFDWRKA